MRRTTIALEPLLFKELKEYAAKKGKTFQECANDMLAMGLDAFKKKGQNKIAFKLRAFPMGIPAVDPADREGWFDVISRPLPK